MQILGVYEVHTFDAVIEWFCGNRSLDGYCKREVHDVPLARWVDCVVDDKRSADGCSESCFLGDFTGECCRQGLSELHATPWEQVIYGVPAAMANRDDLAVE